MMMMMMIMIIMIIAAEKGEDLVFKEESKAL